MLVMSDNGFLDTSGTTRHQQEERSLAPRPFEDVVQESHRTARCDRAADSGERRGNGLMFACPAYRRQQMTVNDIRIRRAATDDVEQLLGLVQAYWRFESIEGFDPAQVAPQLRRVLVSPDLGAGWLALDGDAAVGYLLAVYVFSLEHLGLTAEIDELFVDPRARGAGIGGKLLEAAEVEFAARGCTNASLQLGIGNENARVFYRARGYSPRSGFELLDKLLPAG
jgi:GNAT superfamily N-acetyltransferase